MKSQAFKQYNLPDKPGVYFFFEKGEVIYIGKATSLKDRVKSYFGKDLIETRGPLLVDMVFKADEIKYEVTESVLEALILEANLIKKYQPKYNTKEKSDKSFNYVCITKDYKVAVVRGKELGNPQEFKITRSSDRKAQPNARSFKFLRVFGPFTSGSQLREALKIIRKFFPFIEDRKGTKGKEEFYKQIKLMPENSIENKNNIKNLILFFEGKKKKIIALFKKEMLLKAKAQKFEEANEIKRKIFALNHINDISLIKNEKQNYFLRHSHSVLEGQDRSGHSEDSSESNSAFRLEAYDIAHMSGKNMVGVMTVLEDGEVNKAEYKKFKIKTKSNADDTGALKEVLERRFNHPEWSFPSLLVIDGGKAQINTAEEVLKNLNLNIPIVSVLKDERHRPKDILLSLRSDLKGVQGPTFIKKYKREILLINSEAHRFAITYHKQMRNKNFLK